MSVLQDILPLGECIENADQLDAFLGFVKSQRLAPIETLYLLKARLAKKPSVQQMYQFSVREAEAAHPVPRDGESAASKKKRDTAYLDAVLTSLAWRLLQQEEQQQQQQQFHQPGEIEIKATPRGDSSPHNSYSPPYSPQTQQQQTPLHANTLHYVGTRKTQQLALLGITTVEQLAAVDTSDREFAIAATGNRRPDHAVTTLTRWSDIATEFLVDMARGPGSGPPTHT